MPQVTIEMTGEDFEHLTSSSTAWGPNWEAQAGRFEHMEKKYDEPPKWSWEIAYWVGDSWLNVILAKSWLKSQGHAYEVIFDLAENPTAEFVILTNYQSPAQQRFAADKAAIWKAWNEMDELEPSPVKRIARNLKLHVLLVASVVYPVEQFGKWEPEDEADLPDEEQP